MRAALPELRECRTQARFGLKQNRTTKINGKITSSRALYGSPVLCMLGLLGLLTTAVPGCRKEQDSKADRYRSLMNVGKAHYDNRAATEAIEAFEKAVELFPTEIAARLNLARAYLLARQEDQALEQLKTVLSVDRHSTAAHYLAGLACLRLGDASIAISHLEQAVRQDPSTPAIHFQLAAALKLDHQMDRYLDTLRTVVTLDPNHWSAHYQLAQEARKVDDLKTAQRHLDAFELIRSKLPELQKTSESLERCQYTEVQIPAQIIQPEPEAIEVRFVPRQVASAHIPIAVIDADGDGTPEALLQEAEGGQVKIGHFHNEDAQADELPIVLPGRPFGGQVADFDNDGFVDVLVFGIETSRLLKQTSGSATEVGETPNSTSESKTTVSFQDVTTSAALDTGGLKDAVWVDYDHDADVDLLTVTLDGKLKLWGNLGNGTFEDHTDLAELPSELPSITQIAIADMNDDEAVDIVAASAVGKGYLLRNDGLGVFSVQDKLFEDASVIRVEDFDNDLHPDVVTAHANLRILLSAGGQRSRSVESPPQALRIFDFDNDGWLDLLLQVAKQDRWELRLLRNAGAEGWQDMTAEVGLAEVGLSPRSAVLVADFDADGDSDLVVHTEDGHVSLLSNHGAGLHKQLKITLTGTKSNRSGIGTRIEIRAPSLRLSRRVFELPVEIGVGDLAQLDSVQTIWPNGIVKSDIHVSTEKPLEITEPFVAAGSCPYLYVWDGKEFLFLTDILGASPLGLSLRRDTFVPADTDELLKLGDQQNMQPHDGRYLIQITDELREVLYLDHVHLKAVDHPEDTEVQATDKLLPPPFVPSELWLLRNRKPLHYAHDDSGREWTKALQRIDGERTEPPSLRTPQMRGLAKPHSLTLDFGTLDRNQPLVLALTGWLLWGDAGVNVSASQNPELPDPWPELEAWADGHWHRLGVRVGLPAGKTKTILVNLENTLPQGTTRLRLTNAYETYWDRIALFVRDTQSAVQIRKIDPTRAELRWRGFPKQIRPTPRDPVLPDPQAVLIHPPWKDTPSGWCTRYGDVLELLRRIDDQFVIFNGGDAAVIEFAALPDPPPAGYTRTFFLFCDGWDKDSDYNVRHGRTVEPLPFHGMDDQRYGEESPPDSRDWTRSFNTRWVE